MPIKFILGPSTMASCRRRRCCCSWNSAGPGAAIKEGVNFSLLDLPGAFLSFCAYIVPPSADAVVADFPPGCGAGVVGPALAAEPAGTPGVGAGGAGAAPRVAPPRPVIQTVEKVGRDHSLDSKCVHMQLALQF